MCNAPKIRILIVDDQPLWREAIRLLIDLQPDMEAVAEAEDGREAVAMAEQFSPDVILMDIRMPVMNGIEATRQIRCRLPASQIILITTFEDNKIEDGMSAGAVNHMLKDVSMAQLARAIRAAAGQSN